MRGKRDPTQNNKQELRDEAEKKEWEYSMNE